MEQDPWGLLVSQRFFFKLLFLHFLTSFFTVKDAWNNLEEELYIWAQGFGFQVPDCLALLFLGRVRQSNRAQGHGEAELLTPWWAGSREG